MHTHLFSNTLSTAVMIFRCEEEDLPLPLLMYHVLCVFDENMKYWQFNLCTNMVLFPITFYWLSGVISYSLARG